MNTLSGQPIESLRRKKPLVHHLTNYVTVNDCANVTLAIGASPIMADDIGEVAEITHLAQALVLNIGTLNTRTIPAMILAGQTANQQGIPVILDPVGVGASQLRNLTAAQLLEAIQFAVIRGNVSEISFLAGVASSTKGVDASERDLKKQTNRQEIARTLAHAQHCVVVITGATDVVVDAKRVALIENGVPALSQITGTGCMLTSLIGSFCGNAPTEPFESAVCALLSMGIAGELAFARTKTLGTSSLRTALIDEISQLNSQTLREGGKFSVTTD